MSMKRRRVNLTVVAADSVVFTASLVGMTRLGVSPVHSTSKYLNQPLALDPGRSRQVNVSSNEKDVPWTTNH